MNMEFDPLDLDKILSQETLIEDLYFETLHSDTDLDDSLDISLEEWDEACQDGILFY